MKFQNRYGFLSVVLLLSSLSSCASFHNGTPPPEQPIKNEVAAKVAEYAMMSANAYEKADYPSEMYFPLENLGWVLTEIHLNNEHGLAYDVYKKEGEVVFAFRGTDDPIAKPVDSKVDFTEANFAIGKSSKQYDDAKKAVDKYESEHKEKITAFVGHSLGGGIALYLSAHKGGKVYVFDSSPRVFDGEKIKKISTEALLVYQSDEVNKKLRDISTDWWHLVDSVYVSNSGFTDCKEKDEFGLKAVCAHNMKKLALELLKQGVKKNSELQKICINEIKCDTN